MEKPDEVKQFYLDYIPNAEIEGNLLKAACPFCSQKNGGQGTIIVHLNPDSFFMGYFRCLNRCVPGGFPLYFGRLLGLDPEKVPGFDPDREPFVRNITYPIESLNTDIHNFQNLMGEDEYAYFKEFGVTENVLKELSVGYNRRYLVYPYFQENGRCYAARCIMPGNETERFWHGDENFFKGEFRIFNLKEIDRCENGALFITENEDNLLALKEIGYPGIAVPSAADFEFLSGDRLAYIKDVFIITNNTPESQASVRSLAVRLGFKARLIQWPSKYKRDYSLKQLAKEKGKDFSKSVSAMIKQSKAFSPFSSPDKEFRVFRQSIEDKKERPYLGLSTGFEKMDMAHNGIKGINIMGGEPKAGKSCFFMQISTEVARKKQPVIYYDFENGRRKIYSRTLCRLSGLSEQDFAKQDMDSDAQEKIERAYEELNNLLKYFRVVTDRNLNVDLMRRQIDFIQHETRTEDTLIVIDSLHKLPFKDMAERRTGIDSWLRNMESIRDEQNVTFLVISELSRSKEGSYSDKPDIASFKGSGDIEYSADNAMIFMPDWDILDPITTTARQSTLWMVASRENSPGKIGTYELEYPFWRFKEL